jgi:hypothetical protein
VPSRPLGPARHRSKIARGSPADQATSTGRRNVSDRFGRSGSALQPRPGQVDNRWRLNAHPDSDLLGTPSYKAPAAPAACCNNRRFEMATAPESTWDPEPTLERAHPAVELNPSQGIYFNALGVLH